MIDVHTSRLNFYIIRCQFLDYMFCIGIVIRLLDFCIIKVNIEDDQLGSKRLLK